ncbi:succinate dehydrogenase/fumarate reductase iron-sulfur subunit [Roseospira marina]|uniref:Succinate dehydrogenase iron-sulfur subunit n=1 Tax=Roseospira marina TaxID=140057 RepID=A0A5M6IHD4_9PROT|nr:succinate dehydrogenase/fumarate reductase iron-sulfur subunit [Roseospira marina]KAA5607337.1 succinate dehydrogenase/fumarate reductase iron-sulfur subunit [Roseospira marina]MBB4312500.1 fumarate reductase iron-sulfur subunit [Roseospira marina]MBB5085484.1 fumarate reductase iron-sulfur subunit [Roseospira marina]
MSERQITFEVLRYNPETDDKPWVQTYSVPCQEDWVVLDAINYIKDHLDTSLSYRWSCHMAVCGSCGMMVNGEPTLSCKAFLRDYKGSKIRVEPLSHFPIERDLVVVLDDFMGKLQSVKPYIIPKKEKPVEEGEYKQTPRQLKNFKQYTMCINCMLCYAACPQYGLNDDFIGPAALALTHRYNLDSRDGGRSQRQEVVAQHEGVWECSFVGACSEVCPKDVDPAGAIQQMKIASTVDWYLEHLMPWRAK